MFPRESRRSSRGQAPSQGDGILADVSKIWNLARRRENAPTREARRPGIWRSWPSRGPAPEGNLPGGLGRELGGC
jgi:hypothetical protein